MKAICLKNKVYGEEKKKLLPYVNHEFGEYVIDVGEEFIVMGMALDVDTNNLNYLIQKGSLPIWYPQQLFKISDNKIPDNWFIKIYDPLMHGDLIFVVGFNELLNDDFHDALMEAEDWALEIFYKRLKEQEEYYDDQYWIKLGQKANNK